MTPDERSLLKHGMFWAVVVAGFWLIVSAIHSPLIDVVALIIWSVFLFLVFSRMPPKQDRG